MTSSRVRITKSCHTKGPASAGPFVVPSTPQLAAVVGYSVGMIGVLRLIVLGVAIALLAAIVIIGFVWLTGP